MKAVKSALVSALIMLRVAFGNDNAGGGKQLSQFFKMKKLAIFILFSLNALFLLGQTAGQTYAEEIAQHREEYKLDFLNDTRSPLQEEDLPSLRFFEPDENYRVTCAFERTPDEKPFDLPTYSGITKPYVKYGILTFELNEKTLQLTVYQSLALRGMPQYAQYLFLPFRDLTNDETTYGGGRYIDLKMSGLEGNSPTIDFNKCYNPWCHYSDGYNCPIPPSENTLEVAIEAGEKMWAGEKKHK